MNELPETTTYESGVETAFARNRSFAGTAGHDRATMMPALRLLVVTCLDPRVDPAHVLGLDLGDAMVVRNGGGRVTPEVINNVAFVGELAARAVRQGPLFEVVVIHHTDCGSRALADDGLRRRYAELVGARESMLRDYAVVDPADTVAVDVSVLRSAPAISARIPISGHVYDVFTGLVETVITAHTTAQSRRA